MEQTPVSYTAEKEHAATAKLLCETGDADINAMDSEGWTSLFHATGKRHDAVVKLLPDAGKVIVSWRNVWGNIALLCAEVKGYQPVVDL